MGRKQVLAVIGVVLSLLVIGGVVVLALPSYYFERAGMYWGEVDYDHERVDAEQLRENMSTNLEALRGDEIDRAVGSFNVERRVRFLERICGHEENNCSASRQQAIAEIYNMSHDGLLFDSQQYLYLRNAELLRNTFMLQPKKHVIESQLQGFEENMFAVRSVRVQGQYRPLPPMSRFHLIDQRMNATNWSSLATLRARKIAAKRPGIYAKIAEQNAWIARQTSIPHLQFSAFYNNNLIETCMFYLRIMEEYGNETEKQGTYESMGYRMSWSFERKMSACLGGRHPDGNRSPGAIPPLAAQWLEQVMVINQTG